MPDQNEMTTKKGNEGKEANPVHVQPTLFIGLGGTGMEICLRVRRRILNHVWGTPETPVRISSLSDFPIAQFIHYDLNSSANTETDKAVATDPLASLVKFTDEERLVFPLDTDKYFRTDGELGQYPHIASWFPITRKKFIDLGIRPEDGAGQVRALSRLYFFDKYDAIKNLIQSKILNLEDGVTKKDKMAQLHLTLQPASLRIVVIASIAGGTGGGSFIDMGYLSRMLAAELLPNGNVTNDLMLMLPSAFAAHNRDRTEANAYAALMELETCVSEDIEYVKGWIRGQDLRGRGRGNPYRDIFLFDTGNVASKKTSRATDIYDMVADILFEDFTNEQFANIKRSIAPNVSSQHKSGKVIPPINPLKFGNLKLSYSRTYSSFGQAIIDTQLEQKRAEIASGQVNDMLKVFFGIASDSGNGRKIPPPTPDDARKVLNDCVKCKREIFELTYDFVSNAAPFKKGDQFSVHELVNYLMRKDDKSILGSFDSRINQEIDDILTVEKDQRLPRIEKLRAQLDRDLGIEAGVTDSGARGEENAIKSRCETIFREFTSEGSSLLDALWNAVDNKETGGLDYTIQLIERIKDEIENTKNGLIRDLENNQKKFADLCDKLRSGEMDAFKERYVQTKGKGSNQDAYAEAILRQMGEAIHWYVGSRVRALACNEAAELLQKLSHWLGKHEGLDVKSNRKLWSEDSFAGKLANYEKLVIDIMTSMNEEVIRTREATKQGHAAYQVVNVSTQELDAARNLSPDEAMKWAKSVFEKLHGSRKIFKELEDEVTRAKLIGQLRELALRRLPLKNRDENNPLYTALKEANEGVFQNCMEMAMPWVEAKLDGNWVTSQQYNCIIGVNGVNTFRKGEGKFFDKFYKAVPARTLMSADKIQPLETGVPGKLTCYVELSGIPLFALSLLSTWRESYYKESNKDSKKIPLHTHKDKTLFVHPVVPSDAALERLAEDFKLYIQGVVLNVLKPSQDESGEIVYSIIQMGEELPIGNERNIRNEGITFNRDDLNDKVTSAANKIKSLEQLACLVVLYDFYAKRVYPAALMQTEGEGKGGAEPEPGFGTVMCRKLRDEMLNELKKKRLLKTDNDIVAAVELLIENAYWKDGQGKEFRNQPMQGILDSLLAIDQWTEEVKGSKTDVRISEFGSSEYRPKRVLIDDVLQKDWTLVKDKENELIPPRPSGFIPYKVDINGQSKGPFDWKELFELGSKGDLTSSTKVWRKPMPDWKQAGKVDELLPLLNTDEPPLIDDEPPLN